MFVGGEPKVGKSLLVANLALALATGANRLGFSIPARRRVFISISVSVSLGRWRKVMQLFRSTSRIRNRRNRMPNQRRLPSARQVGLDEMSGYGQDVHRRYPTGDVVVSVRDLAEQFGKRALHKKVTK